MERELQFSKMHGLGNDFMVVDGVTQNVYFSPELICRLADRHTGVGFDQLLLVEALMIPILISIIVFLMRMVAKWHNVAMVHGVLRALCA